MEFVAGVSHELRTPLSVMRTAGHNLRGRVANDPSRVQQYGALIEEQSERLFSIQTHFDPRNVSNLYLVSNS